MIDLTNTHNRNWERIYSSEIILQELAKKFKKEKNLVIAKMDASANDTPREYPVEGFPTIYFATRYVLYML